MLTTTTTTTLLLGAFGYTCSSEENDILWYQLAASFGKRHTAALWLQEELRAISKKENTMPSEETTDKLSEKMKELTRMLVTALQLEFETSIRCSVVPSTGSPLRDIFSLTPAMQQLAFLQKSLLSLAARPISIKPTKGTDKFERFSRFYMDLLLRYSRCILKAATLSIDDEFLAQLEKGHPATLSTDPTTTGLSVRQADTITPELAEDAKKQLTPIDMLEQSSFVGILLPTLITSLLEFAGDPTFMSPLLPTLVIVLRKIDEMNLYLPKAIQSEVAFLSVLRENKRYPFFVPPAGSLTTHCTLGVILVVPLHCTKLRICIGRRTLRRLFSTSSARASAR